jgi:hypothetical protein
MITALDLVAAAVVCASACLTARDIHYVADPSSIVDPLATLRETLQPNCRYPVAIALGGGEVRITDRCRTDWRDRPLARTIDITAMTDVRIGRGDWFFIKVVRGESVIGYLHFSSEAHAIRAANALWVLCDRVRAERCRR